MILHLLFRLPLPTKKDPHFFILGHLKDERTRLARALTMANAPANPKRPTCPSCSKPARLCLCSRIQNPSIENSIGVIILQHSLERKHPLNSARIAKLGLKNVRIVAVSDVNFEACFRIQANEPNPETSYLVDETREFGLRNDDECTRKAQNQAAGCRSQQKSDFSASNAIEFELKNGLPNPEKILAMGALHEHPGMRFDMDESVVENRISRRETSNGDLNPLEAAITATIVKYGVISSFDHIWLQKNQEQQRNFDELLSCPAARDALARGFAVQKLQKREFNDGGEMEKKREFESEFEIEVPPNTALLFPTENAFNVDNLKIADLKVENLIVLDGTWAKAKRMYKENPWLKLVPHLKLDLEMMSLYEEVRHPPKVGFLSTIESIVYALKAMGENPEGLDNLLDVFESMVGDQRRCKDDRWKKNATKDLPFSSHSSLMAE